MKVGIWIDEHINPAVGGGFSYATQLVQRIDAHTFPEHIDVVFVSYQHGLESFQKEVVHLKESKRELPLVQRVVHQIANRFYRFRKKAAALKAKRDALRQDETTAQLKAQKIDLVYYMSQMQQYVSDYPFITTNWDVAHLSMPPFPEIVDKGELKRRRVWYDYTLPKATAVFVESEAGKQELIDLVKVDPDKVFIVPLFPGGIVTLDVPDKEQHEILEQFGLQPETFMFYPAQFWKHKNHDTLVKAFGQFHQEFPNVKLVFSGSDKGNLKEVQQLVQTLGIADQVSFLGFISNEALHTLYRHAIALVMPTFLGPTNMPPLEAASLGCPVLCSDFDGHREQLGNGAIYFDPASEESINKALLKIMDPEVRTALIANANEVRETSTFTSRHALDCIHQHFLTIHNTVFASS
ncbi:MAG: glycosyltransferase family 1 protein [Bacteroidota bacterium]